MTTTETARMNELSAAMDALEDDPSRDAQAAYDRLYAEWKPLFDRTRFTVDLAAYRGILAPNDASDVIDG